MPDPTPLRRTDRTLIARIALTFGLAVLLVIGAWTHGHSEGGGHAVVCVAAGASASAGVDHHGTSVGDATGSDSGIAVFVVVCTFLLALVLLVLFRNREALLLGIAPRTVAAPRAGPVRVVPALTLLQLSVSRT